MYYHSLTIVTTTLTLAAVASVTSVRIRVLMLILMHNDNVNDLNLYNGGSVMMFPISELMHQLSPVAHVER